MVKCQQFARIGKTMKISQSTILISEHSSETFISDEVLCLSRVISRVVFCHNDCCREIWLLLRSINKTQFMKSVSVSCASRMSSLSLYNSRPINFINQEVRRQLLINAIFEGDWRPIMAAKMFFVPNTEAFFKGLVALLQQCGLCCQENSDGGRAEFLARRLEEYQRLSLIHIWRCRRS